LAEDKDNNRDESTSQAGAAPPPESVADEYRGMSTDIAALAMPVAVVTAPVVNAWAKQHFSKQDSPQDPPPQELPKKV
jgi:hypothetical protein